MKRILYHITFWSSYIILCMVIEYSWVKTALPELSQYELVKGMIIVVIVTSLPEICFAYYMMYFGFDRLVKKKIPVVRSILEILVAFIISIVVVRLVTHYTYENLVYEKKLAEKNLYSLFIISRQVLFLGFSSGIAVSIKSLRNQLVLKEREKNLLKEKLSTELKLLRNQLQPHFLFNTLNNIYALARKKSDLAPQAIMKLSELLSFTLYESGKDSITIAAEVGCLEDYISLEKIRYNDRLTITVQKDINNPGELIAPLLLLPLVENAFKHGVSETRFNSYINIRIKQNEKNFYFTIENSFEEDKRLAVSGKIGLYNIRRQLELIYKEHILEIDHTENVFRVHLYLKLNSNGKI